ncbi:ubiquinol-cytochrome-c reductase complex assembly factor 1-like [Glandiceps talaboti]
MSTLSAGVRYLAISTFRNVSSRSTCKVNSVINIREKLVYLYPTSWLSTSCTCMLSNTSTSQINLVRRISASSYLQSPQNQMILEEKPSLFTRFKEGIGLNSMKYNKFKMRVAGRNMYASCVEGVDIEKIFKVCNLPDTFFSWFLVTQLHVWMCMVRLKQEGKEGKYMKHYLILSMWHDIQARGKVLGVNSVKMKLNLRNMLDQFQGVLFAYDEGLMSSDRALAGALWRNVFIRECDDAQQLVNMVEYVRQQVQYLDSLDSSKLLVIGRIKWKPFQGEVPTTTKPHRKQQHQTDPMEIPSHVDKIRSVDAQ